MKKKIIAFAMATMMMVSVGTSNVYACTPKYTSNIGNIMNNARKAGSIAANSIKVNVNTSVTIGADGKPIVVVKGVSVGSK